MTLSEALATFDIAIETVEKLASGRLLVGLRHHNCFSAKGKDAQEILEEAKLRWAELYAVEHGMTRKEGREIGRHADEAVKVLKLTISGSSDSSDHPVRSRRRWTRWGPRRCQRPPWMRRHNMGRGNITLIVAAEAKEAARGETTLEGRLRRAMASAAPRSPLGCASAQGPTTRRRVIHLSQQGTMAVAVRERRRQGHGSALVAIHPEHPRPLLRGCPM